MKVILISFWMLFVMAGCQQEPLASEKWKIENENWLAGDVKTLTIKAPDTVQLFKLGIKVNHTKDYGYQNLYIRTKTTYPSGKEVSSVTSLELIDKDGSWAGDCNRNACEVKLPLQSNFTFPEVGSYSWSIEPFMRVDTVAGIKSLTVTCRKATK